MASCVCARELVCACGCLVRGCGCVSTMSCVGASVSVSMSLGGWLAGWLALLTICLATKNELGLLSAFLPKKNFSQWRPFLL